MILFEKYDNIIKYYKYNLQYCLTNMGSIMNYIEQDTLTKDLRKLKGIMVSLSALETEISIGSINKELDKAVGFFQINFSKL